MKATNVRGLLTVRWVTMVVGGVLLLAFAGAVLGSRAPQANDTPPTRAQDPPDTAEEPPTAVELERIVERLAAAGVTTDADTVAALAVDHGVGGAIRLLWWSAQSGTAVEDIVVMRSGDADTPAMGWGQIAKALDVHPGIGQVMGGGSGRDNAPGQNREEQPQAP
jgi:hypothetical protein